MDIHSFLGLPFFYHVFIDGFSYLSTPLANVSKSGKKWFLCDKCTRAFDSLKETLCTGPCLALPDFEKPVELHTNAPNYAMGGVLMHEGRPVAFESKKLMDQETRYPNEPLHSITVASNLHYHSIAIDILTSFYFFIVGDTKK